MNAGPQQWPEQTEATVVDQNEVASTLPSPSAGFRPVPRRFAHFELEIDPYGKQVELGRGAMGVTYKALDLALRRPVALKVIASNLRENEALKIRFFREARAAAALRHPNIASVFHLGSTESSYFYAMEFVAGKTVAPFDDQSPLADIQRRRFPAPTRPSPNAAPRLRLRSGRPGRGYAAHSGLPRTPDHSAHREVHGDQPGTL